MMAVIEDQNGSNPLLLPEIVRLVVDNVLMVPDLLSCACVNSTWNIAALKRLYNGSLSDMQFRTPDIGSLNCLFVASRERFRRNMTFVKHLLLSSDIPSYEDGSLAEDARLICKEKCRAMRNRQSTELLLRPQGDGLASLTIPFEIEGQDWSLISDLLLPQTVEFLAIDDCYCDILLDYLNRIQKLDTTINMFSSLKALTVYKSDMALEMDELCRLIDNCDLQFFHLEEPSESDGMMQFESVKLLRCLQRQRNLTSLALITPHCTHISGLLSTTPASSSPGDLWPKLKMLYLGVADQTWVDQVPKFKNLQILSLENFVNEKRISQNAIGRIAECRQLQAIDIALHELRDVEVILGLARACPLLRKFSLRQHSNFRERPVLAEKLCTGLLRGLPHLEHLELDLQFRMDGARLEDLARHCPRLTVLELCRTRLDLSLALLAKAHPFKNLEVMHFGEIFFEDPRRSMQRDKLEAIASEWRRLFPKLREIPCLGHIDTSYAGDDDNMDQEQNDDAAGLSADEEKSDLNEKSRATAGGNADREMSDSNENPCDGASGRPGDDNSDLGEESEGDWASASGDEESSESESEHESNGYRDSDLLILRKLFNILGYAKYPIVHDKIQYMWQRNLETEIIGWPVVPLVAFSDPDDYSTTARIRE